MWQADGDDHAVVSPSHLVMVMDLRMMMANSSSHSTALQCWSLVLQHRYSDQLKYDDDSTQKNKAITS